MASSSRRAQPVRQTRTNPPRHSGTTTSRALTGSKATGNEFGNVVVSNEAPGFFPAITHFTDSISALPKEIVRHFTLLKEVDAKAYGPEENLGQLINVALSLQGPSKRKNANPAENGGVVIGEANGGSGGGTVSGQGAEDVAMSGTGSHEDDSSNWSRRQLFFQIRYLLSELLVTLDEKNHVISTANEALQKQLARADSSFPYVENEVSEEARYGSFSHWAYIDKSQARANGTMAGGSERSRRDVTGAHSLAAAASAMAEEAAASRSESRREAMLARKQRQHLHGDGDDGRHKEGAKRAQSGAKVRKLGAAEATTGLGMTNGTVDRMTDHALGPPSKRRKAEKASQAPTSVPMERSISSALGSNTGSARGGARSPRELSVAEPRRRKPRAAPTASARKRNNNNTSNPAPSPLASSPITSTFPVPKETHRNSPNPGSTQRATSSRARQNSAQEGTSGNGSRNRPASASTGARANGQQQNDNRRESHGEFENAAGLTGRGAAEAKSTLKETGVTSKGERVIEDKASGRESADLKGALIIPRDDQQQQQRVASDNGGTNGNSTPTSAHTGTRSSGKASKNATPVLSAAAAAAEPSRSRNSRSTAESKSTKRSHKRNANSVSSTIVAQAQHAPPQQQPDEDSALDEDEDTEPRYCYCNQVSYGEMVACDADDCPREWFHLQCVGLSRAPTKNAKWYCDHCKDKAKKQRSGNGGGVSRPTSAAGGVDTA